MTPDQDLDTALFDFLCRQETLTELIGTRIYPDFAGQEEPLPLIVYELEDDHAEITQQGPTGRGLAVYALTAWAETRRELMSIGRTLKDVLHGYRGAWQDIRILAVILDGCSRSRDTDTGTFSLQMRFSIHYQEE